MKKRSFIELYCPTKPNYIFDFVVKACDYLGLLHLTEKEIVVTLKHRLENESYGICYGDENCVEIQIAQTQFGRRLSREEKLSTLGHELVHAKQYFLGELKNSIEEDIDYGIWKGVKHLWTDNHDELPWEQEAYRLEKEILSRCK